MNKGHVEIKLFEPYAVEDLVVYVTGPNSGSVIEADCRWELTTTVGSCDCCTFRWRSRRDSSFKCRHILALRQVLGVD
ncbi:SWIM zinc finger family protein [Desulfotomaculum sp. 1211_IL3151]|uniref:SWIM zinc finger family protein n=1 Tax=Desulfotomaculum sp. 1211_IL3151 TaxID=3084055 RepID=UPI002FDB1DB2